MEPPSKRRRPSRDVCARSETPQDEDTDLKLALLTSMHPDRSQDVLLDYLLAYNGSVEEASTGLNGGLRTVSVRKSSTGYQSSLSTFVGSKSSRDGFTTAKLLTKKGRTLHLYSPEDVEANTPCSIIHNFLPSADAEAVLRELMSEVTTFRRDKFQMFEREVESPHTSRFYVDSLDEQEQQKTQYMYNGGFVQDVGKTPPELLRVSGIVKTAVNSEIKRRIEERNPDGMKLKFQADPEDKPWQPNVSFVNCYDGAKESVGWHSDHLTYLGPRAVIGSLSLGVAREFRVRKIGPLNETQDTPDDGFMLTPVLAATVPQVDASSADEQGQIAIHLPHNSLLIMHAEMQEEWKAGGPKLSPCFWWDSS